MDIDAQIHPKKKLRLSLSRVLRSSSLIRGYWWILPLLLALGFLWVPTYLSIQHLYENAEDFREQELRAQAAEIFLQIYAESAKSHHSTPVLGLYQAGRKFSSLYPEMDTYILRTDGEIIFTLSPNNSNWRHSVDIKPVQEFIAQKNTQVFTTHTTEPLYGLDPARKDSDEIFSAAPFHELGVEGFIYIILQNRMRRLIGIPQLERGHAVTAGFVVLSSLALIAILLFSLRFAFRKMYTRVAQRAASLIPELSTKSDVLVPAVSNLLSYQDAVMSLVDEFGKRQEAHLGREREVQHVISSMTHDLKTPLALIQEYAEQLLVDDEPSLDKHSSQGVQLIQRNVRTLIGLLSDLDRFFGLKNVDAILAFDLCYVDELCGDLHSVYSVISQKSKVTLVLKCPKTPLPVQANSLLLERAIKNLLENAIRHTPPGGTVSLELDEVEQNRVRIMVNDTGCGIASADLERIFEPYQQIKSSHSQNGSSGLGLAIVQQAIRAHGSEVHVSSQLGIGSRFWFDLPLLEDN